MNIYFKGIWYKIHDYMFYISYKNVFLSKSNIGIMYVRKRLHINSKNFDRFCRNLALKLVQEH